VIAVNIIAVKPAAGPETLSVIYSNTLPIPPIIPEIIPENQEAIAIPKHNGSYTKKPLNQMQNQI
jgi:hypothetical protein